MADIDGSKLGLIFERITPAPERTIGQLMTKSGNEYMKHGLSKSLFQMGRQCHKALWAHKFRPDLRDEVPAAPQAVSDAGTDVGTLARQLFPGGLLVPYEGLTIEQQLAMTTDAIAGGQHTIYEAAFEFDGVFVKVDILHRGREGCELYEVKSSSGVKDVYVEDIALQYFVVKGAGVELKRANLVHVDNSYVREGNIDVHQLFAIVDVTEDIKSRQTSIAEDLGALRSMLRGDEPVIDIGPHCDDPYSCLYKGHCWSHIPSPCVFDFGDIGKPDAFALYRNGIVRMEDTPAEVLGWRQKLQLEGVLGKEIVIDTAAVRKFVAGLWYPLCFLDFETTCMTPVPLFEGTRPYQKVPFQYSLHIVDRPGAERQHHEFLAEHGKDPRRGFLDSLLATLPAKGCIVAWNRGFEIGCLRELGEYFLCCEQIEALIENFRDLMLPFRQKAIYHRDFEGSYSLKSVLPALVPELSYVGMPVSEGTEASSAWLALWSEADEDKVKEVRENLRRYCEMDTNAMVRILRAMEELSQ